MGSFRLIALTPPGLDDPAIAIAASRAGELGVLDLERCLDPAAARQAIDRLARYGQGDCGIKIAGDAGPALMAVALELPQAVKTVIVASTPAERIGQAAETIRRLRERDLTVLLEVTSVDEARVGAEAGASGLIAKGHESAGWVGEETTFVLLQRLLNQRILPVWAHGGIGLHSAAAAYAGGAAGVVLDAQLALTRESSLPDAVKDAIGRMDGSETVCLGSEAGALCRVYARPGQAAVEALRSELMALVAGDAAPAELRDGWRRAVHARAGWGSPAEQVWLLGQDAAFAAPLAKRFHSVGGVLAGIRQAVTEQVEAAKKHRPFDADSVLARAHGTRYPIVQGPMTRVSDRAEFALRVAEGGGLPFLALALMRAAEVEALLKETQRLLGNRPWGVGILGFVPLELRQEQLELVRKYRPPFGLIAGGRPDQARSLENDGIPTYLHVPSPGLLKLFLQDGARRFVFEGRECGGHVGPRSSFVLWDLMVDALLESLPAAELAQCQVLFAGGIHDALSASMVAALAVRLAERGASIGVLLGTAYLFTDEAVASGAIVKGFQEEAVRCDRTVLLETGPGHSTRCADTNFAQVFRQEKQRMLRDGRSAEEIRNELEMLNIGRLRLASKGVTRDPRFGTDPLAPKVVPVGDDEQHRDGMYMIGQVAALREGTCSVAALHHSVSVDGSRRLAALETVGAAVTATAPGAHPSAIAVVGISCMLPKAKDRHAYWQNILDKVNALTEIPKDRWDWSVYFDPDPKAPDKIYSKWGGFLDEETFDPMEFGMPPNSLASIDPMQLLALKAARTALRDAGYLDRAFDRKRASVILGASGGTGDLGAAYLLRSSLPLLFGEAAADVIAGAGNYLPEWTEDSFAGLLPNVAAGRIANRLDFGGLNYVVDAACASSLTAVHLAVKELETHNTDLVVVGGVDTTQNPFGYLCFSKTHALSPTGQPRTFDASADGIAISEGIVMLVLKRLADAERDGDRIYAVIQAVGGSSDGRAKGLTAPRPEGQMLALQRAYAKAGVSPTTVGLFEAHGTGTVVGDRTEALALTTVLEDVGAPPQSAAIGSVKSMIGHTKATAGVAGLAKVALALYHKVLPPTLGVTQPNPKARFGDGPLYVNSEARPWIHATADHPRRAGVNAFGFGGTNFHAVLEEYTGEFLPRETAIPRRASELFLWSASSRPELVSALESLEGALERGARPELQDLAYTLWVDVAGRGDAKAGCSLAIVSGSLEDLSGKIGQARKALGGVGPVKLHDPRGIYFTDEPLARNGKVAFLFPGQGSQYPNMVRDLAIEFPEVREAFERFDRALADRFEKPLSRYVFPPPAFTPQEEQAHQQALTETNVAQPAIGAANIALLSLLGKLGLQPDLVAGHSYGEYVALCAAGVFDERTLAIVSETRGRSILEAAKEDLGTMAAVDAGAAAVAGILDSMEGVWIANLNSPEQTIISGTRAGVDEALRRLKEQKIRAKAVPVACAFHSPLVAPARDRLASFLGTLEFAAPSVEVFSNTTAKPYSREPKEVVALLAEHLVQPVRFADEIDAMYAAGARIFLEVGPRNVLSGLVRPILGDRPHVAIPVDVPGRNGLTQLLHALGQLAAHAVPIQLDRLFDGRPVRRLNLAALVQDTREKPLSPTTWIVTGSGVRPLNAPEAARQAPRPMTPPLPSHGIEHAKGNGNGNGNGNGKGVAVAVHAVPVQAILEPGAVVKGNGTSLVHVPATAPVVTAPAPAAPAGATDAMQQFQALMGHFLDTQRRVMLAYLDAQPEARVEASPLVVASAAAETVAAVAVAPRAADTLPPLAPAPTIAAFPAASAEVAPAVAVATAGSAAPAPPAADVPNRDRLTEQLLRIVGERTGYPPDMLDLDVDIEAELGIDSIKRVEILGNVQKACIPADRPLGEKVMEQLTGIKTLRGIVDWLESALRGTAGAPAVASVPPAAQKAAAPATREPQAPATVSAPVADTPTVPEAAPTVSIPRSMMAFVDMPALRDGPPGFTPERIVLVTDDEGGIAHGVCEQVRRHGGRAVLVRHHAGAAEAEEIERGVYRADLTDLAAVGRLVETVRRNQGAIGGLMHLLPLADRVDFEALDLAAWRASLGRDVKSLYYLAREAAHDLKQGNGHPGWLLAAIDSFFPGHAGISGLMKTLALEWPGVACKAVALDREEPVAVQSSRLLGEVAAGDGIVEVTYQGAHRRTLQPRLVSLDTTQAPRLEMGSDWVVLVTGGARGITAEVAGELAERYRPTFVLVGRSALPEREESPATRELVSPHALKAALMDGMRQAGQPLSVGQVEAAYQRLLKDREIRAALARIERAGSSVRYHQADARDERAMGELVESIYRDYGRLDGVICGAGIIEDKLLEDKTPESFNRVFDTKAEGAFILSRAVRPESLKLMAFFGSAAASFGNRGQSDYAAANEVLNKLAMHLGRKWPARVVSICWGPWQKSGMVSPELQRDFARRGVAFITIPDGCRIFDNEIRYGANADSEVIVAGGTWSAPPLEAGESRPAFPLLAGATFSTGGGHVVEAVRTLDPAIDLYLNDHRIDGSPVLPLAVATEMMAEVVQKAWSDLQVVGVRELRLLKGVVLEDGPRTVKVVARAQVEPPHDRSGIDVNVEIVDAGGSGQKFYRGTVELAAALPEAPAYTFPSGDSLEPFNMSVAEAYSQWLFHGPRFAGITEIEGIGEREIRAVLDASAPPPAMRTPPEGGWLIDPVMFDSGLQMFILWARATLDKTPLPSRFLRFRRFGSLSNVKLRCHVQILEKSHDPLYYLNIAFVGPDGRLRGLLEEMEGTCSRALNRLAAVSPALRAASDAVGESTSV